MTKGILGVVLSMLCVASPAWAVDTFNANYNIAAAAIPAGAGECTGCTRVSEGPSTSTHPDAMQIPADATDNFYVVLWKRMPSNITSAATAFSMQRWTPDASSAGFLCDFICPVVVRPGQAIPNLSATFNNCTLTSHEQVNTQWLVIDTAFAGVTPTDDSGTTCTVSGAHDCRGGLLAIGIFRNNNLTGCASGSANLIDYFSVSPNFTY